MEKVFINGMMVGSIMALGKITKWKEKEFSNGMMVEFMKVLTKLTKKKDMVSLGGKMEGCIEVIGNKAGSMVKESILIKKVEFLKGTGIMVKKYRVMNLTID